MLYLSNKLTNVIKTVLRSYYISKFDDEMATLRKTININSIHSDNFGDKY